MSSSLDPDQARRFFGPDLGPNCLQKSAGPDQDPNSLRTLAEVPLASSLSSFYLVSVAEQVGCSITWFHNKTEARLHGCADWHKHKAISTFCNWPDSFTLH